MRSLMMVVTIWMIMPVEGSKSALRDIYHFMTKDELKEMFDVGKHADVPEYEVVFVRIKRKEPASGERRKERGLSLQFGDPFLLKGDSLEMKLQTNTRLISPSLKIMRTSSDGEKEIEFPNENCHYLAYGNGSVAAISNCQSLERGEMTGLVLLPGKIASLKPVPRRLRTQLQHLFRKQKETEVEDIPHLVHQHPEHSNVEEKVLGLWKDEVLLPSKTAEGFLSERTAKRDKGSKQLYLELALFFDQFAYERFMPFVKNDENRLRDMLLGFVNQLQALYYQTSLRRKLHISLVRLEIQAKQPADLSHHDGDDNKLLTSFCKYQAKKNPSSDNDPNHWDMALYLSALNFRRTDNGIGSDTVMGLAPVGGVCLQEHACVISEFGTVSEDGRPYASAGLTSTFIAAHEMGHNLGMFHDGPPINKKCPVNGFIMSASRGTKGETVWSSCSADVLMNMDKACLLDKPKSMERNNGNTKHLLPPGQVWDAYDQCRIFLRDEEATLYNDTLFEGVCERILCKTPNRIGYYAAGPALEGTFCGKKRWCQHGKCVSWGDRKMDVTAGGWSDWTKGDCKSACIEKSKGAKKDIRRCDNPKPKNTEKVCEGRASVTSICDDSSICQQRTDILEYASQRCKEFEKYVAEVTPVGTQVPHQDGKRSWQACAIYCKTEAGTWYTPRYELNDRGVDTFFPDGTWCHSKGGTDYYCQSRTCLPVRKNRMEWNDMDTLDSSIDFLNNAVPKKNEMGEKMLRKYYEYNSSGVQSSKPILSDAPDQISDDYAIDRITAGG